MTESLFEVPEPCGSCGRNTTDHGCPWCATTGGYSLAADAAMAKAKEAADPTWHREVKFALMSYRTTQEPFTSAHALAKVRAKGIETKDARALGAMVKSLAREGMIQATGRFVDSPLPEHHSAPKREWRWVK